MKSAALACLLFAGLTSTPLLAVANTASVSQETRLADHGLVQAQVASPACNTMDEYVRESTFGCSDAEWSDIAGGRRMQRLCLTPGGPVEITYDFIGGDCYASSHPWP